MQRTTRLQSFSMFRYSDQLGSDQYGWYFIPRNATDVGFRMNGTARALVVVTAFYAITVAHGAMLDLENLIPKPPQPEQPIRPPLLKPFADNRDWVLFQDLHYHVGDSTTTITVPKGFVTDFASIPEAFWSLGLSPNGRYSKAAIVHDYLYWTQGCSRLQADNILLIAMKESDVAPSTQSEIYNGVRLGGNGSWRSNASEKAKGLLRVVPEGDLEFGPTVLWRDYRNALARKGLKDPPFPSNPAYCLVGNTTNVPGRNK